MKKFLSMLIAIITVFMPPAALAETIDFSVYSLEELLQLQTALEQAITDKMRETVATPVTDFIWADNGVEVMLRSYIGTAEEVVIPAEVNGLPVTQIGDSAFRENKTIRSIVIPDGVTTIGKEAFYKCYALESVVLPTSVHTIQDSAFRYCSSLAQINLEYVANLNYFCFNGCSSLTGVLRFYAPKLSMTGTFYDCRGISGIEIHSEQVALGARALNDMDSLTYIYVNGDAVLQIKDYGGTFDDNPNLTTVVLPFNTTRVNDVALFVNSPKMVLYAPAGSWLESYARENFIPCNTTDYEAMNALYALHAE